MEPKFALLFLMVSALSAFWAYADASARDKPGCAVALMVGLFWPLGLLIWIIFRPASPLQGLEVDWGNGVSPGHNTLPPLCAHCKSLLIETEAGLVCPHCQRTRNQKI